MKERIGWIATAAFAMSYLPRSARTLKQVQALAACLWIIYGISVRTAPVVVTDVVVAAMAFSQPVNIPGAFARRGSFLIQRNRQ
jgi:uncharacterized protein with PQ loop repeat